MLWGSSAVHRNRYIVLSEALRAPLRYRRVTLSHRLTASQGWPPRPAPRCHLGGASRSPAGAHPALRHAERSPSRAPQPGCSPPSPGPTQPRRPGRAFPCPRRGFPGRARRAEGPAGRSWRGRGAGLAGRYLPGQGDGQPGWFHAGPRRGGRRGRGRLSRDLASPLPAPRARSAAGREREGAGRRHRMRTRPGAGRPQKSR